MTYRDAPWTRHVGGRQERTEGGHGGTCTAPRIQPGMWSGPPLSVPGAAQLRAWLLPDHPPLRAPPPTSPPFSTRNGLCWRLPHRAEKVGGGGDLSTLCFALVTPN